MLPVLRSAWASAAVAALSGAALAVSFPPFGWWPLAPLAIGALMLTIEQRSDDRPARRGALLGAIFGLAFFGLLLPWLRVIGWDAWAVVVVMSLAFMAVFGSGATFLVRLPGWPLWVAAWWVAVEAMRSRVPLGGFPWGRLGQSQVDAPTAQWAAIGGVPVLGFVVVLSGAVLAWAILLAVQRAAVRASLAAVGGLLVLASGIALPAAATDGRAVTVAVIQGNVPDSGMDAFGRREAVLNAHLEATHQLAADVRSGKAPRPDVVIWPENASDIDPAVDASAFTRISAAVDDVGVPVLTGLVTEVDGGKQLSNQGTVWNPQTGPAASYVKQNLVPFGEYVPFRGVLGSFISRLDRIPRDFVAGDEPGVLDLGPLTVADVICFDVAFDDAVREAVVGGGEVITVQTNNATYGQTGQVDQQWAISRLRAIEHGRPVIVASTSGISGVIGANGEVQARAPEFEQAVLVESVTLPSSETLATRWGTLPELVISLIGVLAVVAGVYRTRREGHR